MYIVQFNSKRYSYWSLLFDLNILAISLQAALEFLSSLSRRADEAAQKFHIEGYNVSK